MGNSFADIEELDDTIKDKASTMNATVNEIQRIGKKRIEFFFDFRSRDDIFNCFISKCLSNTKTLKEWRSFNIIPRLLTKLTSKCSYENNIEVISTNINRAVHSAK